MVAEQNGRRPEAVGRRGRRRAGGRRAGAGGRGRWRGSRAQAARAGDGDYSAHCAGRQVGGR